ncbi:hypothetical protein JW805_20795 [Roseomonas aeriglobus]|nr:hypothetical protein [Roseomonas aeriglobus]
MPAALHYQPTPDLRLRDRALDILVAATTHAALGGAIRLTDGCRRRDWLVFGSTLPDQAVPVDLERTAHDLRCDLIVADISANGVPIGLRAGMRLWGRMVWHAPLRLWRDDLGGRCCLVPWAGDRHLWLETGQIVVHEGAPWRDAGDRDLGFARADAAVRRLLRAR